MKEKPSEFNSWQRLLLFHHRLEQSWVWQTSFCESEKGAEQILCFGIDTLKEGSVLQVLKQKGKYGLENIINWTSKQMWYVPKWCLQPVQIWTKENVSEIFAMMALFANRVWSFDYSRYFSLTKVLYRAMSSVDEMLKIRTLKWKQFIMLCKVVLTFES